MTCLVLFYFSCIHHFFKNKTSLCIYGLQCDWDLCWSYIILAWSKCPCTLVTNFGKYFFTSFDANPGHYWRNMLSIASIHMDVTDTKAAACRYCIRSGSDEVWCVLLICSICVCIGDSLGYAVSGILHNPLLLSIGTWMVVLDLCLIVTSCALESAFHTSPNIFTIETSELCVRLGMIFTSHASSDKAGKYSKHGLLDCIVWPFGNNKWMGGTMFVDVKCGTYTCK